jgi:hypothetical protein
MTDKMPEQNQANTKSHLPRNSIFFEKIIPALLVVMGILTILLILIAAGVILGIIHF